MNSIGRIIQNVFKRSYSQSYNFLKQPNKIRGFSCCRNKRKYLQLAIASTLIPQAKLNVEDDLRKAIEEGEAAILNLMNQLQDLVITTSKEYRICLTKQIELIKKSNAVGQEAWDELPQFRTLGNELRSELDAYLVLLKTIGVMTYDQSLLGLKMSKNSLQTIQKRYKELEEILQHEFEENKLKQKELLEINYANILSNTKLK